MSTIRKILVPVDLSSCSRAALQFACSLGMSLGATLEVLLVLGADATAQEVVSAKRDLERFVATVDTRRVWTQERVDVGDAPERIFSAAERGCADAIVLGTYGRSEHDRLLAGSVAENVVRGAKCPVLTVRESG